MKTITEYLIEIRPGKKPHRAKVHRRTEKGGNILLANGLIIGETTTFYRICNRLNDDRKFDEWFPKTAKLCWTEVEPIQQ